MKFKIWYTGSVVFEGNSVEDWKNCPSEAVLWIAELQPDNYSVRYLNAGDWYYLDEDNKIQYVSSTSWDSWEPQPSSCESCIKQGIAITSEEWNDFEIIVRQEMGEWINGNRI